MNGSDTVVPIPDSLISLGSEVRQLRKARGLTLKHLSGVAGISLSHLSAIERGASKPSVPVLEALADGLDVTPDWFFARRSGAGLLERAYVVRKQNRRNLNTLYGQNVGELGYSDSLLSSSIGGQFYMGLAVYEPFSERPREYQQAHEGEEHGLVVEGILELSIGGEVMTLSSGDSYSFDAAIPHSARNPGPKPCKLVWAVSPVVIPQSVSLPKPGSDLQQRS